LDIEQANTMSKMLKEQTHALANTEFTITPKDFINKLVAQFGVDNNESQSNSNSNSNSQSSDDEDDELKKVDWSAIGNHFASWFLTIPPIQFMNGPLQQCAVQEIVAKKKREPRKKRKFNTDAPKVQPKKVTKQKKKDKTETRSRVIALKNTLKQKCKKGSKGQCGASMIPFVVNPHSYSQTIENLFDLSFIMKEGLAQIDVDEQTQQPVITYVSTSDKTARYNQSKRDGQAQSNGQCIVKFNPSTFCQLIDAYDIRESQIERTEVADDDDDDSDDDDGDEETETENDNNNESGSDDEESQPQRKRRNIGRSRPRKRNSDKEEAD